MAKFVFKPKIIHKNVTIIVEAADKEEAEDSLYELFIEYLEPGDFELQEVKDE